jgi:hypothetical protein
MIQSFSEKEIKAHFSEAIDLAIQEGFVTAECGHRSGQTPRRRQAQGVQ